MHSKTTLLLLSFFFTTIGFAQQKTDRQKINFDFGWKFHFGNASNPREDFNYGIANILAKEEQVWGTCIAPDFNDSSWKNIQLPHDWVAALPFVDTPDFYVMAHGYKPVGGLFPATSIGWYRKTFDISPADSGKRFLIQFDGIYRDSKIWLNGNFVGSIFSGYIGNAFDITNYLHFYKKNVMVVRVNATQYEGWFYEGAGIYRHVWLKEFNDLHIVNHGIFAYSKVNGDKANITVETTVNNERMSPANGKVYFYLTTRDGKIVATSKEQSVALQEDDPTTVKQNLTITHPHLWSLDDPYLYRVVAVIKDGDNIIDEQKIRFGIRTITITADKGLFLNGKHVKIQGVCNHQDHAGVGTAMPDYLQYYRVRLLKEMGANAYRTSHNPPDPALLDACDSLGMLVLDENRLLNSSPEYLGQFTRQIIRDRNHPSVFMWSIGNEEGAVQTNSVGKRIALTLINLQHRLDPTRICTYAADVPNVYQGINEIIPVRGFNYRVTAIDAYHHDHPDQPVMGTEMGSTVSDRGIYRTDSVMGYLPDHDTTYPWWASTAEQWWKIAATRPWFMGGFVWTGFDYRGEPTPFAWPNINSHFGLMDVCGFPKNIYYYYQAWWTNKDVLNISPHWNWQGEEGKIINVWVNSNADSVKLLLNGKDLGTQAMPRYGHLEWNVAYEPGTLEAIAYKDGRTFSAKEVTTGIPYKIILSPDRKTITADGEDATVVNVSVTDDKGNEVPTADNLIEFSISGQGKIIGVGNGDPSSHEPDQYANQKDYHRHLFNGKCQVILESSKQAGSIALKAFSPGLPPTTCVIKTIN
jgi:beta-galactosidase